MQLKLGVKCIGVKTVCAAKSLYQFWEEMFKVIGPTNSLKNKDALTVLLTQNQYGLTVIKRMIEVLVQNFPERVVCDFMDDVIIQVLLNVRLVSVNWFIAALSETPQYVLNNGEKESFINNLRIKDYTEHKDYYEDFFDKFYKRCRSHNSKIY